MIDVMFNARPRDVTSREGRLTGRAVASSSLVLRRPSSQLCRSGRGFGGASSAEDARKDGELAYGVKLFEQQLAQQAAVVAGRVGIDGNAIPGSTVVGAGETGAFTLVPIRPRLRCERRS